jgi:hypothetical protein
MMKLSNNRRAIISELLSVGDLCRHDPKARDVVRQRVSALLSGGHAADPRMLSDDKINEVYASLKTPMPEIGAYPG